MAYKDLDKKRMKDRAWYHKNLVLVRNNRKRIARQLKQNLVNMLGGKCGDCDEQRVVCLEFHHPLKNKEHAMATLIHQNSKKKAYEEAKKCIVLCKNCHAVRHRT